MKLDAKECTANDGTHLHIFIKFLKKNKKKQWKQRREKMSKAIDENKWKITIKKNLYENSVYIGNLCVQTKIMTRLKRTYLLPASTPVTVF